MKIYRKVKVCNKGTADISVLNPSLLYVVTEAQENGYITYYHFEKPEIYHRTFITDLRRNLGYILKDQKEMKRGRFRIDIGVENDTYVFYNEEEMSEESINIKDILFIYAD